jgi:hypothetical protein
MVDHWLPVVVGSEAETQLAFIEYLRECLLVKLDDVSEHDARRALVPSGTNLLWLVKHCAGVESFWLHHVFAGDPEDVIPDDDDLTGDTVGSVQALYRGLSERTAQIVADHDDLGDLAAMALPGQDKRTLRWVLAHLVEESGRHAGHADILREQIDGSVGR